MRHARKLLHRVSSNLDKGDVSSAAEAVMQLCTSVLHRHASERELFFSTGRGAAANGHADGLRAAEIDRAVRMMDSVLPEVRGCFARLHEEDQKLQASSNGN